MPLFLLRCMQIKDFVKQSITDGAMAIKRGIKEGVEKAKRMSMPQVQNAVPQKRIRLSRSETLSRSASVVRERAGELIDMLQNEFEPPKSVVQGEILYPNWNGASGLTDYRYGPSSQDRRVRGCVGELGSAWRRLDAAL
jgi:hypothetical protein